VGPRCALPLHYVTPGVKWLMGERFFFSRSWTTPGWTARSCVRWSRTAIISSRIISRKTTTPRNNSKSREQTHAVSNLCKRRKRCVHTSPHTFSACTN
jgi:hypothetical protein